MNKTIEQDKQKLERIFELASILGQQNDYQEILRLVSQKTSSLLGAQNSILMMINPRTRQTVKTIFKEPAEGNQPEFNGLQTHISGWIIKNKQSFKSENIKTDNRFSKKLFKDNTFESVLGVPLLIENILFGTLLVFNIGGKANNLNLSLEYLEKLAVVVAPFLRNAQNVKEYFKSPIPQKTLLSKYEAVGMIGKSKNFVDLLKAIESAASCDVRVILEGQSGTGKEMVARAIHQFSGRVDQPFVAIDCGAIPENLIESELFGHVKGAFSGAVTDRRGLFEEANRGTLFMDEIANLPLDMQTKLMRVLQSGEIRPLGSNKPRITDVRIISASSKSLRKLVNEQQFREDLFYRLHVYPVQMPSLDERQVDIPILANHFLEKFAMQQNKKIELFHEEIYDFMQARHWAGNIRELENFVERLVALASQKEAIIKSSLLPDDLKKEMKEYVSIMPSHKFIRPLNESLSEYEKQLIHDALIANNWNQSKTARILKTSEQTLRYKMGKLGISRNTD
ncbi:MAG: sigma-54-dependent Fis family transcriptional regulator [Calditrichaeota bacterium]|nr:MAG: GAF domain-containing protein [Calditrichota bacterium]MBL1205230.1 sigma-54-dependent Fis family transcriptional regulator [Calditrichota bacterium]NOG45059.1 sigma-54-dependent Fis family transcriptional regulator [Calditrichota bacterium]